ncbi:MAG: hypothetical protein RLZZ436_4475 [Planctomycetota bacterium]|jgi:hypothetical protein
MSYRISHAGIHPCAPGARLLQVTVLAALLASLTTPLPAQTSTPHVAELRVGLQAHGQPGRWLPLQLHATGLPANESVQLKVSAPDPRGDLCETICGQQRASADGTVRLEGAFCSGRLEGTIRISLCNAAGQPLWQHDVESAESNTPVIPETTADALPTRLFMNRQTSLTLLTIGQQAGIRELESQYKSEPGTRDLLRIISLDSMDGFPSIQRGLDSIDVLLLTDNWQMTDAQGAAIREWVLAGGHLIVSCAAEADQLLNSPLGRWIQPKFGIPQTANTLQTLDLTAIQNFVLGAVALQTNRNPVTVLRIPSRQPRILVQSLSDPLISRTAAGAGVITLTAVSLNSRPLNNWLSLPRLYEMLLFGEPQSGRTEQTRAGGRIASVGITDLSTQLAAASDALPDNQRWSTWHVMVLMVALLVFVGPLDYLLVVRVLKAPRLTWITLPIIIAAGCLFAAQGLSDHNSDFSIRQIGLLDVFEDSGEQRLRARTWASLSAGQSCYVNTRTADATWLQQTVKDSGERSLMWSGRIENIFGGMYRPGGAGLGQLISRHAEKLPFSSEFTALPLLADGSTALLTDRRGSTTDGHQLIKSSLRLPANALLEGSFSHHLPDSITNWVVICGNRIYAPSERASDDIRELQPGEVWSREQGGVRVLEIRDFLRGVRLTAAPGSKNNQSPNSVSQPRQAWDVSSRNPLDILLITSLYDAAGGRSFVQLRNDALRRDELSDTIGLSNALLIGATKERLADVQIDEKTVTPEDSVTVVRLLLPVEKIAADRPQAETSNEQNAGSAQN